MIRFPLQKPLNTEKSASFTKEGKYVFMVEPRATKPEIKKAVEHLYRVHVVAVRIIRRPPKQKRMGQMRGMQSGYKKAIVAIRKGEIIDVAK